jgi:hypothetical protein
MTGSQAAFVDLNTSITGTIRFGNGSVIRIQGCGTVLFACQTGEHRTLDNVYYISCLTAHIITIGQMDEHEFKVLTEDGVMRIFDTNHRLLTKVHRGPSRLYVDGEIPST